MGLWNCFKTLFVLKAANVVLGISQTSPARAGDESVRPVPQWKTVRDAPDALPPGNHGDLIWPTEIKTEVPGARACKVLYRSTGIQDVAVPVSGMFIAPVSNTPAQNRPVVSWARGTTGIARHCAASMVDNPAKMHLATRHRIVLIG